MKRMLGKLITDISKIWKWRSIKREKVWNSLPMDVFEWNPRNIRCCLIRELYIPTWNNSNVLPSVSPDVFPILRLWSHIYIKIMTIHFTEALWSLFLHAHGEKKISELWLCNLLLNWILSQNLLTVNHSYFLNIILDFTIKEKSDLSYLGVHLVHEFHVMQCSVRNSWAICTHSDPVATEMH